MERREWLKCALSPAYFLDTYGYVYDAHERDWIRFRLWPAQYWVLQRFLDNRLVVVLKARQLGLSWLSVGFALWLMQFRPAATVLFFSKRDDEAVHLLDFRLKGMYERLPGFLRCRAVTKDSGHEWRLSNGSAALAFPTTGGRSYTATLAIVDEADFAPDLQDLLNAVKPTIDAGGRLILLSTADKAKPQSVFKRIYRAARRGESEWLPIFLPWSARPDRDVAWYEAQKRDIEARDGSLDALYQEYPATDEEALAARMSDKRFPFAWLRACYVERVAYCALRELAIPGLDVYEVPRAGRAYVIGADPAEGNPISDDSTATVLDAEDWAEVASLAGKFEPAVFAAHLASLAEHYNGAGVLVERNNHGHAVLLWLRDNAPNVRRLKGHDGKEGWLSNTKGKALMYDHAADCFRDGSVTIRSPETLAQLASIEGATLRAPEGEHDDRADSFVLALAALKWRPGDAESVVVEAPDLLGE